MSTSSPSRLHWFSLLTMLIVATCYGCRDEGADRVRVTGNITHRGEPVPAGVVVFEPDSSAGNSGSQGFALIKEGRYDTGSNDGKHAVPGPTIIRVNGFDGKNASEAQPHGRPLFSPYETSVTLSEHEDQADVDVP